MSWKATIRVMSAVILALCARLYAAGLAQGTGKAQEHADRAMQAVERRDLTTAEVELRQAVELAPRNPIYLGTLGAILGTEQKLEDSNVFLEKALVIIPNDFATRRNLASNQFLLGLLHPAKKNLERVLRLKPGDPTSVLLLGMVEEELKDYVDAAKCSNQFLAKSGSARSRSPL